MTEQEVQYLPRISHCSRLVVTGQIGPGKSTLSRQLLDRFPLQYVHIDDFIGEEDPLQATAQAIEAIDGGRVAQAYVRRTQ